MRLNYYETIYIIKPNITEAESIRTIDLYHNFLKNSGAYNIMIQNRGRRHLSYNIYNCYDGIYIQMNYYGNASLITSLQKHLQLDKTIFRHLTLKQKEQQDCNTVYK